MILISLDEGGQFEKPKASGTNKYNPPIIAGVIYEGNDTNTERNRIKEYYTKVIEDAKLKALESDNANAYIDQFKYPAALHSDENDERRKNVVMFVKQAVSDSIGEFLSAGTYKGRSLPSPRRMGQYYTYCMMKSETGISGMNSSASYSTMPSVFCFMKAAGSSKS